jgi:hypothetical protein
MTQRIKGFVVSLSNDMREDDVEQIVNAIRLIKGVSAVQNIESNIDDQINRMNIKLEMSNKIFETLSKL